MLAVVNTSRPFRFMGKQKLFSNPLDGAGDIAGMMDIVHQNCELVSPQSRNRIRIAQRSLQPAPHLDQQKITQRMAHAVVDHLESIEVHIEDGKQIVRVAFGYATRTVPNRSRNNKRLGKSKSRDHGMRYEQVSLSHFLRLSSRRFDSF